MANGKTAKSEVVAVVPTSLTPVSMEQLRAMETLRRGEVPPEMVRSHPGRAGKVFTYLAHTYATSLLLDGFGPMFSHDVLSYQMMEDGTAVALVRLQIHMPIYDAEGRLQQIFTNSITEVGAYAGSIEDHAYCVAAAASRGLVKCLMRRFGVGIEFYKTDDRLTPEQAWDALWRFVSNQIRHLNKQQQKEARNQLVGLLKEAGVSRETLVDHFEKAYAVANDFVAELRGRKPEAPPPMPGEEEAEPEPQPKPAGQLQKMLEVPLHQNFPRQGFKRGDPLSAIVEADHAGEKAYRAMAFLAEDPKMGEAPAGTEMRAVQRAAAFLLEHWAEVQEIYHNGNGHEPVRDAADEKLPY